MAVDSFLVRARWDSDSQMWWTPVLGARAAASFMPVMLVTQSGGVPIEIWHSSKEAAGTETSPSKVWGNDQIVGLDLKIQEYPEEEIWAMLATNDVLTVFARELDHAAKDMMQRRRASGVYRAVFAVHNLVRALLGGGCKEAAPYVALLGALEDLQNGRLNPLLKPVTKYDSHPIATNEWNFRAVAAAQVTALHQAGWLLSKAATQIAQWLREAGHDVTAEQLHNWRKDLMRQTSKRSRKQQEKRRDKESDSGLEAAKKLYSRMTHNLTRQLNQHGPDRITEAIRRSCFNTACL